MSSVGANVMGAVFNLNHPAHTVDWNFIHLSVANVVVIGLMFVVFLPGDPAAVPRRRGATGRSSRRRRIVSAAPTHSTVEVLDRQSPRKRR